MGREYESAERTGNVDFSILKGLAKGFKDSPAEFRKLVQIEHPSAGKTDFAGMGRGASSAESRSCDGVMGGAERPECHKPHILRQKPRDGVNLGDLHSFFQACFRENGSDPLCGHCLSGARRADHEEVMKAGYGDFRCPAQHVLAPEL